MIVNMDTVLEIQTKKLQAIAKNITIQCAAAEELKTEQEFFFSQLFGLAKMRFLQTT